MKRYKLAIIGYGGMGSQHARLISRLNQIEVSGTFDILDHKQQQAKEDGYRPYASFQNVLGDLAIDLVLIATPNDVHKSIAIDALQAGKNVICEKPVTLNCSELDEILEVERLSGKRFFVHQNRRWDDDFLTMKKIYDEKMLGDVFHIETRVQGSRGIPGDWRKYACHGGGMVLDWGIHLLDRLMVMVDEKVKTLYCKCFYATKQEVDDGFILHLTFESGKTAVVEVGTRNYITHPKWYMCGTVGTAVIHDWLMNGKITKLAIYDGKDAKPIVAGAGLTKTMAPREDGSVTDQPLPVVKGDILDFYMNIAGVLDGNEEPIVKNSQVLKVMKLIDAAFESDRTGRSICFE